MSERGNQDDKTDQHSQQTKEPTVTVRGIRDEKGHRVERGAQKPQRHARGTEASGVVSELVQGREVRASMIFICLMLTH